MRAVCTIKAYSISLGIDLSLSDTIPHTALIRCITYLLDNTTKNTG